MGLSTRTLVFSDIEGSTSLLDRAGNQYRALLSEQRRIVRTAVEHAGGIEHGTEGDSFFLTFDSPTAGLAAAVEAQRAIETMSGPTACACGSAWEFTSGKYRPTATTSSACRFTMPRALQYCSGSDG
jgi:hypothetical protein